MDSQQAAGGERMMETATLPRPTEKIALVSFFLVFLCGGLAGAVAMSYWEHRGHLNPGGGGMSISIGEWKQELALTDEQTRVLISILDDFSRYYDNLSADGNSRIIQILNPEQQKKFRALIQKHKHPPPRL